MTSVLEGHIGELNIKGIIGFDGSTVCGIKLHPDGIHIVYPLGNKVTICNWNTKEQRFLSGHTNIISAIDLSVSGKYVASGQINHIGFRALVIIWSFDELKVVSKHEVHKVRVEAVAFSLGDKYLISLGGRDCSSIIVWDIARNKPLCGGQASKETAGEATNICITNRRELCFVTAGDGNLTVWKIDYDDRKLVGIDVNVSKLKRSIYCMQMNDKDEVLYCGTSTGDILKIKLNYHHDAEILDPTNAPVMCGCYARLKENMATPQEQVGLYSMGVRQLMILDKKILMVGGGDGAVEIVEELDHVNVHGKIKVKLPTQPQLLVLKATTVHAMVTSLNRKNKDNVLVGTVESEIYMINLKSFDKHLLITCHTSTIYDLAFPHNFSEVFATASKDDVRVWNMQTKQELLRIKVANFCCSSLIFGHDGKSILTAWNDGIIRSFTPLTGRLIYSILNAHNKGVSAISMTENDSMIISGGCEGQVRLWDVTPYHQSLICTLKEHKGPVSEIHINKFNDEAVSASTDGTCIIWDLVRKCRKQILFANTLFMCVRYYPTAVQILTSGSDRKVAYWEVLDGNMIRELDGSQSAGVNSLDISPDGDLFVTGGNDQLVKLWKYQEGITTHIGKGHSAVITSIRFSPNGKYIISTSASGSIFIWDCPFEMIPDEEKKDTSHRDEVTPLNLSASLDKDEEHISDLGTDRQEKLKKKHKCPCECKCIPKSNRSKK